MFFYITVPPFCVSPTTTGPTLVPVSRGTNCEVFRLLEKHKT